MFRVGRLKYKNTQNGIIQHLIARQSTAPAATAASNKSSSCEKHRIVIPKKIIRGPTDLLYTLSKTVGKDRTAAHYKYHDDPYLMPNSLYSREQFALSQEAGKQAAKWIKSQHADLYNAKEAQPVIEAFLPKKIFTDQSEVEVKNLEDAVESLDVADAILIYRLLAAQNVTVPDDLKQNLLELVCFYNHNDPIPFDMFEERSAKEAIKRSRDAKVEVWDENCFADQLFQSIEPKTAAAYNTMIRALFKYNSRDRGEELYNEAVQNGITIDLATHNAYLQNISKPGLTVEVRWEQIRTILSDINKQQLKPDVHTLNAILHTIKTGGNIHSICNYAYQTLAEFKKLNVEPSLATYSRLLDIFHGKQSQPSNVIYQIVEQIEKNPDLKAQTVDDLSFFYKAMVVCRFRLKEPASLARRIDNILTHSDNIKFLGDPQLEQFYYRYFLTTILHNEPFSNFLRTYDQLVPETYSLEPVVADDIFSAINVTGSIQFIPKFWSDMIVSGISRRTQLNDTLLALMNTNQPDPELKEHEGLVDQFADIAWSIYQNTINEQFASARKEEIIPATRLSLIVTLLVRANQHANARTIVESCLEQQRQNRIVGALTAEALSDFINSCVENREPKIAIQCVAYSIENGVGDPIQLGRKIVESFTLPPHEVKRIIDLVGQDVLKSIQKSSQ